MTTTFLLQITRNVSDKKVRRSYLKTLWFLKENIADFYIIKHIYEKRKATPQKNKSVKPALYLNYNISLDPYYFMP